MSIWKTKKSIKEKKKVAHTEAAGELPPRRYCGKYPGEDGELI